MEGGSRDESAFSRLLDRLPGVDRYETDAYRMYEWSPRDRHVIGKGGAVNWNEGLHSKLRSKLNRLAMRTKKWMRARLALCATASKAFWLAWRLGMASGWSIVSLFSARLKLWRG